MNAEASSLGNKTIRIEGKLNTARLFNAISEKMKVSLYDQETMLALFKTQLADRDELVRVFGEAGAAEYLRSVQVPPGWLESLAASHGDNAC